MDRDLPHTSHGDDRIRPCDRPGLQSEGGQAELWHFPDRCFLLHGPAVLHGVRTSAQVRLRVQGQADPVFRDAEGEVQYPDIALSRVERDLHDSVPHHSGHAHSSWGTLWNMSTGYMHLYFVFVLLQFFLLYLLLHPYLKGRGLSLALILAALSSIVFYAVSEYLLWTGGGSSHFFEWHWGKFSPAWALFFFWGVWLGDKPQLIEKISRHAGKLGLISLALFIVYVWEVNLEYEIFMEESRKYFLLSGLAFQFVCANFTIGAMWRLDKSSVKMAVIDYAVSTGKDTFGIYLSHIAVLMGLVAGWEAPGLPGALWPKLLVMPALAWIICDGLVRLCRLRGLGIFNRFLFGGRG